MFLTTATLERLQSNLLRDVLGFLPELILCAAIVLMLLLRLLPLLDRMHLGSLALVFTCVALGVSWNQWTYTGPSSADFAPAGQALENTTLFTGLLAYDAFTIFLRLFLFSFTALVILLSLLTGIPDREDSADFYCLLLGATVGMSLMASANHLLMVYIAVEMASLPSYALAGFLKGRRQSSEAALKYVVYGGGASGIMLYGISLLAGRFGTGYLPDVAIGYQLTLQQAGGFDAIMTLGTLFILIGIGFKLAAVPFQFWCPDVFEGAAAEVAGFLSVASKGAALALLGRLVYVLAGLSELHSGDAAWLPTAKFLVPPIAFFAALTATFGNLAAYMQTNLKRLLAYSTIAHAGYMMMGLATLTRDGASAVLFYLVIYLLMNLGAFAVVAMLRNQTGSEDLADFRGLVQRAPVLVVTLAVFLLSLLGIPPLAGFAAKFQIVRVLFDAGQMYAAQHELGLSYTQYVLLVVAVLNTVLSAVYYIKVLKVMILDKPADEAEERVPPPLDVPYGSALYVSLLAALIFVGGIFWNTLAVASDRGVEGFRAPVVTQVAARMPGAGGGQP